MLAAVFQGIERIDPRPRMLQRVGVSMTSAELRMARMRAKVNDLCRDRDTLYE